MVDVVDDMKKSAPLDLFGYDGITHAGAKMLDALSDGPMLRATLTLVNATGAPEYQPTMLRFVTGFAIGEADALRRAALALSDPRAKGRERDVVLAMADGLDIEDALRGANRKPPPEPPDDPDEGNVLPFRR